MKNSQFKPLLRASYKITEINNQNIISVMHKDGGHWSNIGNIVFGEELAKEYLEKTN